MDVRCPLTTYSSLQGPSISLSLSLSLSVLAHPLAHGLSCAAAPAGNEVLSVTVNCAE